MIELEKHTKGRSKILGKSFKDRIKNLREDSEPRISQQEICKILEISDVTYQSYEYGKSEPRISTLIKLAKLYETSIDYIAGLTDQRHPYPPPHQGR